MTSLETATGTENRLDPRAWLAWTAFASAFWFFAGVAGAVFLVIQGRAGWALVSGLAGVTLAVAQAGWARVQWSHWSWIPWDDALELRYGVVTRAASLVPYHRIQQIDVQRSPVERLLGLSSLVLRTAAATSDAQLPGIASDHAEDLRRRLLERAGLDDAV